MGAGRPEETGPCTIYNRLRSLESFPSNTQEISTAITTNQESFQESNKNATDVVYDNQSVFSRSLSYVHDNSLICNPSQNLRDNITYNLTFGTTNARSLWEKREDLFDNFHNLDMFFAVVTETWFYESPALVSVMNGAREEEKLEFINYCRKPDGRKNRGGGVSIVFDPGKISMKKFNTKTAGHELVVAKGKIGGNSRPLFVVAVYISTRLTHRQKLSLVEVMCNAVLKIKTDSNNPYIVIAGDLNKTDISCLLTDYPDMKILPCGPTRGSACLDVIITNFSEEIVRTEVRPPLTTGDEVSVSDHSFPVAFCSLRHRHQFQWVERRYRPMKKDQIEKAASEIRALVWEDILPTMFDPDEYTVAFHQKIIDVCERVIPWKSDKIRSTDQPWVTDVFRKKVLQRKSVFKRQGRDRQWKKLKSKCIDIKNEAREAYYNREVEKMKQPGVIPFQAMKNIRDTEKPPEWSVSDLFPGEDVGTALERSADFFSKISQEFDPLNVEAIPSTYDREPCLLSVKDVTDALQKIKKPRSYVSIDIPPPVLKLCYDHLAAPLTPIVNLALNSTWWPSIWKCEEVSVIPKGSRPDSLDQTRNISCTSIFSKLTETFLLRRMDEEIALSTIQ